MGHKTKADRQREARERLTDYELPRAIRGLEEAMKYANVIGASTWDLQYLRNTAHQVMRKLVIQQHGDKHEAASQLRRLLAGAPEGTFVAGPYETDAIIDQYLERRRRKIEQAQEQTKLRPYQRDMVAAILLGDSPFRKN
jgi:hypothetical protein